MEKKINNSLTKRIPMHELSMILKKNSKRDLLETLLQWKLIASELEKQLNELRGQQSDDANQKS